MAVSEATTRMCPRCGIKFAQEWRDQVHCSERCREIADSQRSRVRVASSHEGFGTHLGGNA